MGKEAAVQKVQEVQEEIRRFAEQLRRKVYAEGHPEWGTLFSEIEELGVQLGDAVCREFVQQSVEEQARADEPAAGEDAPDREHRCPTCGGPLELRDPEPHLLLTRRGEVVWEEPQAYCAKCRKAFFPSVEESGHSG